MNEALTLNELAKETKVPLSFWYRRSRRNDIPGMFRLGRHIRIDRERFYEALRKEGAQK